MSLRFDEIAEILRIIDNSSCDEIIVETDDIKLVVRRNGAANQPTVVLDDRAISNVVPPSAQAPATAATTPPKIGTVAGQVEVLAPMVGTFFRAPTPDAPPFVEEGTVVKAGQPLCLIEVMKLFTTINSEVAGRVVQIGVDNGELVEYGRTLFVIEPV